MGNAAVTGTYERKSQMRDVGFISSILILKEDGTYQWRTSKVLCFSQFNQEINFDCKS
jgi:hypothetical protein